MWDSFFYLQWINSFGRSGEQILGMCIDLKYELRILKFECRLGWISGLSDHSLYLIISRRIICVGNRRSRQRNYENATKQSSSRCVLSLVIIWQNRKRWGKITPSLNISMELTKRIDKQCKPLAFKFPAVITGRVDNMNKSLVYDHCNFRFLSRYIFCL